MFEATSSHLMVFGRVSQWEGASQLWNIAQSSNSPRDPCEMEAVARASRVLQERTAKMVMCEGLTYEELVRRIRGMEPEARDKLAGIVAEMYNREFKRLEAVER